MAVVWIPPQFQDLTGGREQVRVSGANLRQVIRELDTLYPGMGDRLLNDDGSIQRGIAAAIDGEAARLGSLEPVGEESEVHFIPAMGGG